MSGYAIQMPLRIPQSALPICANTLAFSHGDDFSTNSPTLSVLQEQWMVISEQYLRSATHTYYGDVDVVVPSQAGQQFWQWLGKVYEAFVSQFPDHLLVLLVMIMQRIFLNHLLQLPKMLLCHFARVKLQQYHRKKKEKYLYSTIYTTYSLKALRHGSHSFTCKLHHTCLSFVSIHQKAPPLTEIADIQLQLTTHLSTQKGWKAELAWQADL